MLTGTQGHTALIATVERQAAIHRELQRQARARGLNHRRLSAHQHHLHATSSAAVLHWDTDDAGIAAQRDDIKRAHRRRWANQPLGVERTDPRKVLTWREL